MDYSSWSIGILENPCYWWYSFGFLGIGAYGHCGQNCPLEKRKSGKRKQDGISGRLFSGNIGDLCYLLEQKHFF